MNFIIAGASKGTGRELAKVAAKKGHQVAAIARSKELLNTLKKEGDIVTYPLDLANTTQVEDAFKKISGQWDGPTTLVYTAATWTGGESVRELGIEDFKQAINLNFYSALNPILSFLKFFKYSVNRTNTIIAFGATASLRGGKNCAAFAIPKCSLRYLCQSLAREEGKNGLHVSHIILDGLIDNERTRGINPGRDDEEYMQMTSIVDLIFHLSEQPRDAWTFELDLRPYNENF